MVRAVWCAIWRAVPTLLLPLILSLALCSKLNSVPAEGEIDFTFRWKAISEHGGTNKEQSTVTRPDSRKHTLAPHRASRGKVRKHCAPKR
jgi:hypothetical protein